MTADFVVSKLQCYTMGRKSKQTHPQNNKDHKMHILYQKYLPEKKETLRNYSLKSTKKTIMPRFATIFLSIYVHVFLPHRGFNTRSNIFLQCGESRPQTDGGFRHQQNYQSCSEEHSKSKHS